MQVKKIKTGFVIAILMIFCTGSCKENTQSTGPQEYLQEIKTDIKLPEEAGKNVAKLLALENGIAAITENRIYLYSNGKWSLKTTGSGLKTGTLDTKGEIWAASAKEIISENLQTPVSLPDFAKTDTILSLLREDEQTLLVGTTGGLLSYSGEWETIPFTSGKRIYDVAKDKNNNIWLATSNGLLKREAGKWQNLDSKLMSPGMKRTYFSLKSDPEKEELIFGGLYAVAAIAADGNHWIYSGASGLPYGPVTTIKKQGENLWLGTPKGAIKKDERWHYYCGKRWLPDDKTNDILPVDEFTVWIATPQGISQIQQVEMTLEQKADEFEKILQLRHNRRGLINRSLLSVPGDLSTSYTQNEDNDGLWTSNYLSAECFRYAVTKSEEAKKNAIRTFEALERLETITGIPGYPARTYALAGDTVVQSRSPHPKRWHYSPDGEWQWLDDTSSDEIVGHIFSVSLFYDLVADEAYKTRARELTARIMDHIINNDFHLIEATGKPTKWGVWNPDSLNNSGNWAYERGLNSLQILSHLKTAAYMTGSQKYEEIYRYLVEEHGYAENARTVKMYEPFENSHSDDILTYLPYYNLIKYADDDKLLPLYIESLERSWNASRIDRMPPWIIIASASLNRDCGIDIAVEELRQYPMDLISWTMENSHRWDLRHDQLVSRTRSLQATAPVPTPESDISRWNTNPRHLDSGAGGLLEEDGTWFLFSYWMGRYHKFFDAD